MKNAHHIFPEQKVAPLNQLFCPTNTLNTVCASVIRGESGSHMLGRNAAAVVVNVHGVDTAIWTQMWQHNRRIGGENAKGELTLMCLNESCCNFILKEEQHMCRMSVSQSDFGDVTPAVYRTCSMQLIICFIRFRC
ncbi:hypothetical protein Q5P01_008672 [Channa striata]|uniref:Uncharacterized protein n=1 Tax=Channa striata TaxID=64152 RepID=A0AA88SU95_CHASR|nr:hypothetical protein Q5P01_008672 [Channa striata]